MEENIQIRTVLDALNVYDTSLPRLNGEISAYEAGIRMILEEFDRLTADLFLETATQEGLRRREALFRAWGAQGGTEELRAQLAEREKIRGCFVGELKERLSACGIRGEIVENHEDGILIRIDSLAGVEKEQAMAEAEAFLPAHLPCYFEETTG